MTPSAGRQSQRRTLAPRRTRAAVGCASPPFRTTTAPSAALGSRGRRSLSWTTSRCRAAVATATATKQPGGMTSMKCRWAAAVAAAPGRVRTMTSSPRAAGSLFTTRRRIAVTRTPAPASLRRSRPPNPGRRGPRRGSARGSRPGRSNRTVRRSPSRRQSASQLRAATCLSAHARAPQSARKSRAPLPTTTTTTTSVLRARLLRTTPPPDAVVANGARLPRQQQVLSTVPFGARRGPSTVAQHSITVRPRCRAGSPICWNARSRGGSRWR
mmetsp:Transcript_10543/g.32762  ORF Transcript_10543/g.32762 Transcript_10543/m.32762 type:complete len:270 (+) Transcript_10543:2-811(+)